MSMYHHRIECECEECFKSWSAAQDGPNKIGAFSVALKRIAALEAELNRARHLANDHGPECHNVANAQFVELRDQLSRAAKERDELITLLSDVSQWLDGWCPNATCCAASGKELQGRIIHKLESEKKGGGIHEAFKASPDQIKESRRVAGEISERAEESAKKTIESLNKAIDAAMERKVFTT